MTHSDWKIRSAQGEDLPFIYSTWSRSFRYDSYLGKNCKNSIFFPFYNRVIDWILTRPDAKVLLAVLPEQPNVILSYVICQPKILHYAFTKEAFQFMGIVKSLIQAAGPIEFYTHKTFQVCATLDRHPEMIFNPFLLFQQHEENYGEEL